MNKFFTKRKIVSMSLTPMKRGVTIIELLIIFVVITVLFSIVSFKFLDMREQQVLKNTVSDAVSSVNKARSQTLSSLLSSSYGIHFEADKIIIFKGTVFSAEAEDNEVTEIISPATISNVTLNGSSGASGDIYFSRLDGVPSKTGTVTISTGSSSVVLTISTTGSISTN
jgi:Tfp pilus assembly protein FimT